MLLTNLPAGLADGARAREMTLHDIPAVHALEMQLFPADAWPLDMFLAEITHETRGYIVLEIPVDTGTQVIGYAGLMCVADTADVQTIAVTPAYEGRGYGRALLDFLAREAVARGAEQILLEVRADNPRAQDLYLKNGYQQIHVRRRYYNDGVDALIMRRDLTEITPVQGETSHDR
ncbi:ribosomal protein S18-alanine N-acetyltransferase [Rothia nasimurium]|uniref:ribosomal protein S18-alanine N-acetyltransferase n=1 Tax=Rothia nasimurium TaxID=85336 RepID=UPI001F001C46|nr:ribosomal protein S18-alanine N-acetyltransferase [Rothia nasimurium]